MVFFYQFAFLLLFIMSVLEKKFRSNGDVDNPGSDIFAEFINSNVTSLVRATQILAIVSYNLFADSSLQDVITGMMLFHTH